jgi:cytochrome c5
MLISNAINGLNAMPARGGNPNLSDAEIRASVLLMLADSGIDTGESAATGADAGAAAGEAVTSAAPADSTAVDAEGLYAQACAACHDTGAANAPKSGDKDAWAERLGKGLDTLVDHAVNGFNAMPAKGGAAQLSDAEVAAIVEYMVENSK